MSKLSSKKIEKIIIKYVNASRTKRHIPRLRSNYGLTRLARGHSRDMRKTNRIWHGNGVHQAISRVSSPKGFFTFLLSFFDTYTRSGENVAMMPVGRVKGIKYSIKTNKDVAKALHSSWMHSHGHKRNILNSEFRVIGVGVKRRGNKFYATQIFCG